MTINKLLNLKNSELIFIINEFDTEFSSHDFIKKFAKRFELEYIEFLNIYKGKGAFQKVHSQVAKYLSINKIVLGIVNKGKKNSENIFGDIDNVEYWEKDKL